MMLVWIGLSLGCCAAGLWGVAKGQRRTPWPLFSLACTALALWGEYSRVARWVQMGDLAALQDVTPFLHRALWVYTAVLVVLNAVPAWVLARQERRGRAKHFGWKHWAVLLALCIAIPAVRLGWQRATDYSRILQANWGVSLPRSSGFQLICERDQGPSFHGDGLRCHVYAVQSAKPVDDWLDWRREPQGTKYQGTVDKAAGLMMDKLGVGPLFRPDLWDLPYWYERHPDNSELIIFWDRPAQRLYVLESFL